MSEFPGGCGAADNIYELLEQERIRRAEAVARAEKAETELKLDRKARSHRYEEMERKYKAQVARLRTALDAVIRAENVPGLLEEERDDLRKRKDAAYEERNRVVALLASVFPSGIKRTAIEGWDDEWHGCVYIDTPRGQLSWHYHDSHARFFEHLPAYGEDWDRHDTAEKYARVEKLAKEQPGRSFEAERWREALRRIVEEQKEVLDTCGCCTVVVDLSAEEMKAIAQVALGGES